MRISDWSSDVCSSDLILKHSDQTPLCAELLYRAFTESGLPPGVFQFVHATHDTVARIMRAPEINYVSFTGSVFGGTAVEQACAGRERKSVGSGKRVAVSVGPGEGRRIKKKKEK